MIKTYLEELNEKWRAIRSRSASNGMKKIILLPLLLLLFIGNTAEAAREDMEPGEFEILQEMAAREDGKAATTGDGCIKPKDFEQLFNFAICILYSSVIPFLFGLALVIFLAGIVKFVKAGDNEEAREAGRGLMIFGIISLFVMMSVWGFVRILTDTFGFKYETPSLPPRAKSPFQQ